MLLSDTLKMHADARKHTVLNKHTTTVKQTDVRTLAGAQWMGTVHIYVCIV